MGRSACACCTRTRPRGRSTTSSGTRPALPAGLTGRWHRHRAAHTIVVLEGRLEVNGREIGPGAYCHFPAGEPMRHLPAGDAGCTLLNLFHAPSDVEQLEDRPV